MQGLRTVLLKEKFRNTVLLFVILKKIKLKTTNSRDSTNDMTAFLLDSYSTHVHTFILRPFFISKDGSTNHDFFL